MSHDNKPPVVEYARPVSHGRLVGQILGGIFGYLLGLAMLSYLLVFSVFSHLIPSAAWIWLATLFVLVAPLPPMLLLAWWMKSRPMMIAALITFGAISLSCGSCALLGR